MAKRFRYVLAYDVTSDREREQVARVLLGFGFRAQLSVFECELTPGSQKQLLKQLRALDLKTGGILAWRIQAGTQRLDFGQTEAPKDAGVAFIL